MAPHVLSGMTRRYHPKRYQLGIVNGSSEGGQQLLKRGAPNVQRRAEAP